MDASKDPEKWSLRHPGLRKKLKEQELAFRHGYSDYVNYLRSLAVRAIEEDQLRKAGQIIIPQMIERIESDSLMGYLIDSQELIDRAERRREDRELSNRLKIKAVQKLDYFYRDKEGIDLPVV